MKVLVWNDGSWDPRGSLYFDKYYREQQLDLNLDGIESGSVRVKLLKEGGGSAHIDAALFGGQPATDLCPESPTGPAKLAAPDFDVLHGFDSAIELHFDDPGKLGVFSTTARIEPERLDGIPFQLPLSILMKIMSPDVDFWAYELDSNRGSLAERPDFEAIGARAPFFKEFLEAGSGHPSDYAYGWVLNDDHNL